MMVHNFLTPGFWLWYRGRILKPLPNDGPQTLSAFGLLVNVNREPYTTAICTVGLG